MPTCIPNTLLLEAKLLQGLSDEAIRLKIVAYAAKMLVNSVPGTDVTPSAVMSRGKAMLALATESIRVVIFRCLCIFNGGSCPINTQLSDGKLFSALSSRDQLIFLAQLFTDSLELTINPDKNYYALSEREQWISVAILLDEFSSGSDTNPNTLLSGGKDFTRASEYDQMTTIEQQVCNT